MASFQPSTINIPDLQQSSNGVQWLAVPAWLNLDWLWHGFSTRKGGVSRAYLPDAIAKDLPGELNLGFTSADTRELVQENRYRFAEAVTGNREAELATVRQVHSAVTTVKREGLSGAPEEADGIMSDRAGVLLAIQTADCIPVLVADPVRKAVAAFHAGWRGTLQGIVERGVARMQAEFGSDPADLIAAIGPGIGPCCYTVGDEVRKEFEGRLPYAAALFPEDAGPGLRLDLIEANRRQLMTAGLNAGAVSVVGGCTGCQPEFFYSHRTSSGHAGRMMSVIGVR